MNRFFIGTVLVWVWGVEGTAVPALAQHEHGEHAAHEQGLEKAKTVVPTCPVTDEPANLAVSVATDNGPVFFCCKDCIAKYQANPGKYATKVAAQRKALSGRDRVQVACPVTGEPVDQKVFVEYKGHKVFFCCKGCIKKFNKDPNKYHAALANSYTYQAKCPITGEDIDPQTFSVLASGLKVYYCCKGCDKKFFKDPSKYVPKLGAQGYVVGSAEMKHKDKD